MRRIVLPMTLVAFACSDDPAVTGSTDEGSSSGGSESSSASSTDPSATNPATSEVDSSGSMTDPDTGSSEETNTNPETTSPEETGPQSVCGDGMIEGDEVCEGTNFGDNTCESQGYMQGELTCSGDCLGFNTDGCYICGNDNIEGPEECDGELDNNVDCESVGYTEGEVSCIQATCLLDVSQCTLCGDGVSEGNEQCDGVDFGGATCESLGFTGGTLSCDNEECGMVVASCTGGMWSTNFESGTFESQFYFSGDEDWVIDGSLILGGSFSAHSGDIGDSQTSILRLDVGFAADGTVAFNHRESTQSFSDYLEFRVDGTLFNSWAGLNNMAGANFPVDAGNHTLEWRFTKDAFSSSGNDAVYIDDIVLTGGVAL